MDTIALAIGSLVWGAVLVGIAIALQTAVRISGAARQALWRIVATLIVAPWLIAPVADWAGIGLPAPAPVVAPIEAVEAITTTDAAPVAGPVATAVEPAVPAAPIPWQAILIAVIAAGWIWRVIAARLAARALNRIVASSIEAGDGPARRSLEAWSRRLNLKQAPGLLIVAEGLSPFSFGAVRAVICLPEGLDRQLDAEALDLVVGHECLHVARGDGWLRPVERIAADLLWFNPFAWHVRRELDVARELACDEAVLKHSNARRAYAHTLRNVAGITAGLGAAAPAASMSLAGSPRSLMLRVKQALSDAKAKPARAALVGVALVALAGIPVACVQGVAAAPKVAAKPAAEAKKEPVAAPEKTTSGQKILRLAGDTKPIIDGPARLTGGFGYWADPFTGKPAFHEGIDLAAYWGAPIHAPVDGVVTFAGLKGAFGRVVELDVGGGAKMRFGHLNTIEVKNDVEVKAGDVIGTMGSTGRSTGPHVHFEYILDGKLYDPRSVENLKFAASLDEPQLPPTPPIAPRLPVAPRASAEVEARIAEATRSLAETKRRFEQGTVSRAQLWEAEDALAIAEAAIADMKAGSEPGKGIASAEAQLQAATHQAAAAKLSYAMSRQQQSSYDDAVAMAQAAVADAKAGSEPGKGVATAEVQLQVAIRQAQEAKRLFDLGAASQEVLSSREAAVRLAQARLADLQARAPQPLKTPSAPAPQVSPAPGAVPTPRAAPVRQLVPAPVAAPASAQPELVTVRAPFAARVLAIEPVAANGAVGVRLQQMASRARPIPADGCIVFYSYIENPRVAVAQMIFEGSVIGFGKPGAAEIAPSCQAPIPAMQGTPLPQPEVRITNAPSPVIDGPARFTSGYGLRADPFTKKSAWHDGIDIAKFEGATIHAPRAGVVTFAGDKVEYGNLVELDLGDGFQMRFGQLQEMKVKLGDKVKAGDAVGTMGSSGPSTGPHLHFEVFKNGKTVDPMLVQGLTLIGPG